jgi:sulfide:quinone oxidoreductase
MAHRTVLVLGGGVGGLVTANELRRRLDPADRVVVVERERRHLFQPSLLWLMVGRRRRDQIERPLRELLAPGVELVEAEVRSIDPAIRRVETTAEVLVGDALVLALGAEPDRDAVAGYREAAHDFFSPEGAAACAAALEMFRRGRVVVAVAALPYKCPAAPYEAALLLDDELRRRGLRGRSEIDVYSPEPAPMPVAGPAMGAAVVGLLEAKGIRFHPGSRVERFEPGSREVVLADRGRAGYDLLAGVPRRRSRTSPPRVPDRPHRPRSPRASPCACRPRSSPSPASIEWLDSMRATGRTGMRAARRRDHAPDLFECPQHPGHAGRRVRGR